jgi:GNAT superfamily N-acetyltransferase
MDQPVLARYAVSDQAAFADLVNEVHAEFGFAFHPRLDADLAAPGDHYRHLWVLKINNRLIGSVALTPARDGTTMLKRMYLRQEFRGRGWGERLLRTAIEAARRDGCTRILLDTSTHQERARRLYERAGFVLVRRSGDSLHYAKGLTRP